MVLRHRMATFADLNYVLGGENLTIFVDLWPALVGTYMSTKISLKFEDWHGVAEKTKLI